MGTNSTGTVGDNNPFPKTESSMKISVKQSLKVPSGLGKMSTMEKVAAAKAMAPEDKKLLNALNTWQETKDAVVEATATLNNSEEAKSLKKAKDVEKEAREDVIVALQYFFEERGGQLKLNL